LEIKNGFDCVPAPPENCARALKGKAIKVRNSIMSEKASSDLPPPM